MRIRTIWICACIVGIACLLIGFGAGKGCTGRGKTMHSDPAVDSPARVAEIAGLPNSKAALMERYPLHFKHKPVHISELSMPKYSTGCKYLDLYGDLYDECVEETGRAGEHTIPDKDDLAKDWAQTKIFLRRLKDVEQILVESYETDGAELPHDSGDEELNQVMLFCRIYADSLQDVEANQDDFTKVIELHLLLDRKLYYSREFIDHAIRHSCIKRVRRILNRAIKSKKTHILDCEALEDLFVEALLVPDSSQWFIDSEYIRYLEEMSNSYIETETTLRFAEARSQVGLPWPVFEKNLEARDKKLRQWWTDSKDNANVLDHEQIRQGLVAGFVDPMFVGTGVDVMRAEHARRATLVAYVDTIRLISGKAKHPRIGPFAAGLVKQTQSDNGYVINMQGVGVDMELEPISIDQDFIDMFRKQNKPNKTKVNGKDEGK